MRHVVRVRSFDFEEALSGHDRLDGEAEFWSFVVAQRDWWAYSDQRRWYLGDLARETLVDRLGLEAAALASMRRVLEEERMLEVVVSRDPEAATAGARAMPWEYLLTSAARAQTVDGHPATIVRCLDFAKRTHRPRKKRKVLYVQSEPGHLSGQYTFEDEKQIPAILAPKEEMLHCIDPSLAELRQRVAQLQPDIIHLAGFDTHLDCILRQPAESPLEVEDGMMLADGKGGAARVPARKLAAALCAGRRKPELVLFNLYNASGDLCYEAVRAGAEAAFGFQHAVDDALAELFIAELYRMLGPRGLPLSAAMVAARERLAHSAENIHGTGFVFWSRSSRLDEWLAVGDEELDNAIEDRSAGRRLGPGKAAEKLVRATIVPFARINYALLHNRRPLFRRFEIRNLGDRVVTGLNVEVKLQVGNESFPCTLQETLQARVTDLRDKIRLPLVWALHELPTERVQTTLTTRVTLGKSDLVLRSDPVFLQPIDLWVDDDVNRQWLPSFVLPRDPSVRRVIAAAQRYLDALSDDFSAGFDGYQSIDPQAENPFVRVDAQVQAIWNALIQEFTLRYVNPPPTFELLSQRLRTPSDLLQGGRGTCIDLALLLAACLEYVEIYPALFLLEGHAFVGYWRSDAGYHDFIDHLLLDPEPEEDLDLNQGLPPEKLRTRYGNSQERVLFPWVYDRRFYRPVFHAVHRWQQLVPLEATGIPFRSGFWESIDQGSQNLRSVNDFHAVIDLVAARDHAVTPLPFSRREE